MARGKKTGGRQKGSKNKIPGMESIREKLTEFIRGQGLTAIVKHFNKLQPKDQLFFLTRILPFVTPAYQSVTLDLDHMSEQDQQFILEKVIEREKERNAKHEERIDYAN